MAERLIMYTSSSEGITLGVQGATWMECLLALSEEFGDGLLPLYERTKEELTQVSAAVAETFEQEMKDVAHRLQERASSEIVAQRPEPVQAALEEHDLPSDDPTGDAGDAAVAGAGSTAPVEVGKQSCIICGGDVNPDYASFTEMMHGETRCPDCVP